MRFDVLTLFPEIFDGYVGSSVLKLAIQRGLAIVVDIDHSLFGRGGHGGGRGHLGQLQLNIAFQLRELGCHHKKNYQQEHDIDHRRQVEMHAVVMLYFQRHRTEFGM